jgi:hypothetical protein
VGDEDSERADGGSRTDQATGRTNLSAPGLVVCCVDRVQEGGLDLAAAERKARCLARAAEPTRQHGADAEPEPRNACADRARLRTTCGREVPLRRAIGEVDGILVLLRLVGCSVSQDEHKPAALELLDESRTRAAGCAGREEQSRARCQRRGGDSA